MAATAPKPDRDRGWVSRLRTEPRPPRPRNAPGAPEKLQVRRRPELPRPPTPLRAAPGLARVHERAAEVIHLRSRIRERLQQPDVPLPSTWRRTGSDEALTEQAWSRLGAGVATLSLIACIGALRGSPPLETAGLLGLILSWPIALAISLHTPGMSMLREIETRGLLAVPYLATTSLTLLLGSTWWSGGRTTTFEATQFAWIVGSVLLVTRLVDRGARDEGRLTRRVVALALIYSGAVLGVVRSWVGS